jgi:hypothetical protein
MPYIDEDERQELNDCITTMVDSILDNKSNLNNPNDFANYLGRINYCFSRVIASLMQEVSYKKIAMATGVLENIKQELYRRVASPYEDMKINQNGDIREYRRAK